jgi:hypothetical protein
MPKFTVYGKVVGSKFLGEFVAKDGEEAKDKAAKNAGVFLCHQCSSECEDPEIVELIAEKK